MEIAQISIGTGLDLSGALRDLQQFGAMDRKPLRIVAEVNDSQLTALNKHLDLKQKHIKEVAADFKRNVITAQTDDRNLTQLNKSLDVTQSKLGNVLKMAQQLKGIGNISVGVSTSSSSGGQAVNEKMADAIGKAVARHSKPGLAGRAAAFAGRAAGGVGAIAGQVGQSLLFGVSQEVTKNFGKGLSSSIEKSIGGSLGSTELVGGKIGDAMSGAIAKRLGASLPKEIQEVIKNALGEDEILKAGLFERSRQRGSSQRRVEPIGRQAVEERRDLLRQRFDARGEAENIAGGIRQAQSEVARREKVRDAVQGQSSRAAAAGATAEKLAKFDGVIGALNNEILQLIEREQALTDSLGTANEGLRKLDEEIKKSKAVRERVTPESQPDFYRQAVKQVAGNIKPEQMPKLVVDDARLKSEGAKAAYSIEANALRISKDMDEALKSGRLTIDQMTTLFHELQHAVQFDFGSAAGVEARIQGKILNKPAQPSASEVKTIAPLINRYDPRERLSEADAEITGRRLAAKAYEAQEKQRAKAALESKVGYGGLTGSSVAEGQINGVALQLKGIKSIATTLEIDVSDDIGLIATSFASLANGLQESINKIAGADKLSSGEIDALSEQVSKQFEQLFKLQSITTAYQKKFVVRGKALSVGKTVRDGGQQKIGDVSEILDRVSAKSFALNVAVGKKFGTIQTAYETLSKELNQIYETAKANKTIGTNEVRALFAGKAEEIEALEVAALKYKKQFEVRAKATQAYRAVKGVAVGVGEAATGVAQGATQLAMPLVLPKVREKVALPVGQSAIVKAKSAELARATSTTTNAIIKRATVESIVAIEAIAKAVSTGSSLASGGLEQAKKAGAEFTKAYAVVKAQSEKGNDAMAKAYALTLIEMADQATAKINQIIADLKVEGADGFASQLGGTLQGLKGQISRKKNLSKTYVEKVGNVTPYINTTAVSSDADELEAKRLNLSKLKGKGNEKTNELLKQAENNADKAEAAIGRIGKTSQKAFTNSIDGLNEVIAAFERGEPPIDIFKDTLSGMGKVGGFVLKGLLAFSALSFIAPMFTDFAKSSLAAALEFEGFERLMTFVTGSASKAQSTFASLGAETKAMGSDFKTAIAGQSQLMAATKDTALEGAPTAQIGEAARQASTVLSTEDADRVNLAFSQMASKGKISAEELRQQLGEVLPGAFQIFARSIGVTTTQLDGMLQRGEVGTETLVKFASQLKSETSTGVAGAANSAQGSLNRFNNEIYAMQVGFGKALLPVQSLGLNALTVALQSLGVILPVVSAAAIGFGTKALLSLGINALTAGTGVAFLGKGLLALPGTMLKAAIAFAPFAAQVAVFVLIADAIKVLGMQMGDTEGAAKDFATSATKGMEAYLKLTGEATDKTLALANSLKSLPKSYAEEGIIGSIATGLAGDRGTEFLRQREQDIGRGGRSDTGSDIARLFGIQNGKGAAGSNPTFTSRSEKEGRDLIDQINEGNKVARAMQQRMDDQLSKFAQGGGAIGAVRGVDLKMRDLQAKRGMLGETDDTGRAAIDKEYAQLTKDREKLATNVNALNAAVRANIEGRKAAGKQIEEALAQGGLSPAAQAVLESQLKANTAEIEKGEASLKEYGKAINIAIEGAASLESKLQGINDAASYRDNRTELGSAQMQTAIAIAQTNGATPGQVQSATTASEQATQTQALQNIATTMAQLNALLQSPTTSRAFGMSGLSAGSTSADIGQYIAGYTGDKEQEEFKILQEAQKQKQQLEQLQTQSAQGQAQLAQSQAQTKESLRQTTKEINDYVRGIGEQIEDITRTIKQQNLDTQIQKTKNDIQRNLSGFSDRFFGDFIGGLDQLIDLINEPMKRMNEANGTVAGLVRSLDEQKRSSADMIRNTATGFSGGMASQAYNLQNPDGSAIRRLSDVADHHDYQSKDGRNVYDMTLVDQANNDRVAVPSAFNGTVDYVGNDPTGYGNFVDVKDLNGAIARFAHLAEVTVKAGQQVMEGQSIGLQGSTGGSTGVHLHAELPPQYAEGYIQRLTQGTGSTSASRPTPTSNAIPSANFSTNAAVSGGAGSVSLNDPTVRTAIQFYLGQGYSPAGAAYMVGNLIQESNLDPTAVGDGGNARGLSQVVGERQRGLPSSFMDQLAFVPKEFERDTPGITSAFRGNDINAIKDSIRGAERFGVEGDRFGHGANLLSQLQQSGGLPAGTGSTSVPGANTSAINPALSQLGGSIQSQTESILAQVAAQNEGSAIALRQGIQASNQKLEESRRTIIDEARQYSERYQDSILAAFGDSAISQALQQITSDSREIESSTKAMALTIKEAEVSLDNLKAARERIASDPNLAPLKELIPGMDQSIAEYEQQIDRIKLARDRQQRILSDRRNAVIENLEKTGREELRVLNQQVEDLQIQQQQGLVRDPQLSGMLEGRTQRMGIAREFESESTAITDEIAKIMAGIERLKADALQAGSFVDPLQLDVANNQLTTLDAKLTALESKRDLNLQIIDTQQLELLRQYNKEQDAALLSANVEAMGNSGDTFGSNQLQFFAARSQLTADYWTQLQSINQLEVQQQGQLGYTAEKFDMMRQKASEFSNVSLDNLRQQFPDLATTINQTAFTAFQGLSGSISSLIKGTGSLEDVFDSFASGIIDNLVQIGVSWASNELFSSFMGGGKGGTLAQILSPNASGAGGGGDTISSILSMGVSLFGGLDNGGLVPGRYSGKPDQHVARVNPGEFMFKREAVAFHGAGKLNAMNNLQRFDDGGFVGEAPRYKDYAKNTGDRQSNEPVKVQYEVTKINEVNYVTAEQFERGMRETSAQTEKRMNRSMKNSPSYRSGIGI